jgi:hypothetical protein
MKISAPITLVHNPRHGNGAAVAENDFSLQRWIAYERNRKKAACVSGSKAHSRPRRLLGDTYCRPPRH